MLIFFSLIQGCYYGFHTLLYSAVVVRCNLKWRVPMRTSYNTTIRRLDRRCFWILEQATVLRCRLRWDKFFKMFSFKSTSLTRSAWQYSTLYFTEEVHTPKTIKSLSQTLGKVFWTQLCWNLLSGLTAYMYIVLKFSSLSKFQVVVAVFVDFVKPCIYY